MIQKFIYKIRYVNNKTAMNLFVYKINNSTFLSIRTTKSFI